jgi:hypothetical protein
MVPQLFGSVMQFNQSGQQNGRSLASTQNWIHAQVLPYFMNAGIPNGKKSSDDDGFSSSDDERSSKFKMKKGKQCRQCSVQHSA